MIHYERILLGLSIAISAWRPGLPEAAVCVSLAALVGLRAWIDRNKEDALDKMAKDLEDLKERMGSLSLRVR